VATTWVLLKVKFNNIPLVYRVSDVINWKGGDTFRKFNDFDKNKEYDVIVIGSSHAYRGYDPRFFKNGSINMFNLGTSAQSLLNTYYIAKHYITPSNCKLVIVDIYDGALSTDGLEATADLTQNITSTACAFKMGTAMKDPRVINMLTVRMLNSTAPPMYSDTNYVFNGFCENKDTLKNYNKNAYNAKLNLKTFQMYYLEALLIDLKNQQIEVIAVTHPSPVESHNYNFFKNREIVSQLMKKYNIPYWDYSSYALNTRTDFYDLHHLNQSGVEKFNALLIKDLKHSGY
jgi:hypothetical protein